MRRISLIGEVISEHDAENDENIYRLMQGSNLICYMINR